jgi:hypothetical protein
MFGVIAIADDAPKLEDEKNIAPESEREMRHIHILPDERQTEVLTPA